MNSSTDPAAGAPREMSGPYLDYYNGFYREISRLDAAGNHFSKIEKLLPALRDGATVLDIGAGHGSVSEELVKRGFIVHALEANVEAIDVLKSKGFVAHLYDISQPIALGETFDLILLLDVLEHVFEPVKLLAEAAANLADDGRVIVTVPLYFDLFDRLRILRTGKVVSYDNLCYGKQIYAKFRSYNYDHIRFFRPADIGEIAQLAGLRIEKCEYGAMPRYSRVLGFFASFLTKAWIVKRWPGLLAHSMSVVLMRDTTISSHQG